MGITGLGAVACGVCLAPRDANHGARYLVEKCQTCGDGAYTLSVVSPPPVRDVWVGENEIWCGMCQGWVARVDLIIWTGDDSLHHLCPGCDSDLLPVEGMDEENLDGQT